MARRVCLRRLGGKAPSDSPVSPSYRSVEFTGEVNWVEIDIPEGAPDDDQAIRPEERLDLALAKE